jgi:hypothetical protein
MQAAEEVKNKTLSIYAKIKDLDHLQSNGIMDASTQNTSALATLEKPKVTDKSESVI